MLARWFLALLLLLHPARGVLAAGQSPPSPAPASCAATDSCCPLCEALPACPCDLTPQPDPDTPPAVPPVVHELPRVMPAGAPPVWREPDPVPVLLSVSGARAPPAPALTAPAFLSILCVWTT